MQLIRQHDLFGNLNFIGDTEAKLADLYNQNPDVIKNTKRTLIEYWKTFEGLSNILGDKIGTFESWFINQATSSETLTRCIRSLKENGTIKLSEDNRQDRQTAQEQYRQYWSNRKNGNGGHI